MYVKYRSKGQTYLFTNFYLFFYRLDYNILYQGDKVEPNKPTINHYSRFDIIIHLCVYRSMDIIFNTNI